MSALRPQTIVLTGLDRIGFRFRYAGKSKVANNYPMELIVGAMFRNLYS